MYNITDIHLSSTELCVLGIHLSHLSQSASTVWPSHLSQSTSTLWPSHLSQSASTLWPSHLSQSTSTVWPSHRSQSTSTLWPSHLSQSASTVWPSHLSQSTSTVRPSHLSQSTSTVWPSLRFGVSSLVFYAQSTSVVISGQFPILSSKYTLHQVLKGEGYYFLDFNIPSAGHGPMKPLHTGSSTKGRGRLLLPGFQYSINCTWSSDALAICHLF